MIGGITRLSPLTGLTLPFMAQGGSSLVSNWIIVGILLRISNEAREPAPISTAIPTVQAPSLQQIAAERSNTEVVDLG